MTQQQDQGLAQAIAEVARALQAEKSAQDTLQKTVELAVATVAGCEHAGIMVIHEGRMFTPAASSEVPVRVDEIQYHTPTRAPAWTRSAFTACSRPTT